MTPRPLSVTVSLGFILLNALIWLVLGIIIAANALPGLPDLPSMKGILAFLSITIAGFLVGLFAFIRRRSRRAYFLTLIFFIGVCILSVFDDFGLSDLVVLVINIIPIVLLIKDRAWYLQVKSRTEGSA
ncbi:MAG: hypothetical protein A2030_02070 [Chloroflexi bacterium RBG_19FT_COMBO_50_10]|nr:MAG: hypothetical protein A2Y53_03590 [Chloroflexi bacterium RBG_16_47_49]OGO66195.1 MAG: hypothetical protein A2030_02070 [Chloroflexi bacterium RBG_19FT_COMBO_50_10]